MPKRKSTDETRAGKTHKDEAHYRDLAYRAAVGVSDMLVDVGVSGDVADLFSYCANAEMDEEDVKLAWAAFRMYALEQIPSNDNNYKRFAKRFVEYNKLSSGNKKRKIVQKE